ncbi:hypothetical protein GCM10010168_65570 [Actinoplanes ianthinogenes]|uniref:Knr4/Smi1-like domain-containing protein n=1 Tax=Actinoplanes ianthinogenes TaxID=122358 RepID=A0ABM7LS39_9ACTN|nr:hypothetical protein [Actinoplanes ianthinogenes]BCJ42067.1 hypothetical protein Aiant_27240 [Actinoplanes ianthinogenes]GGR37895.1 hypothetical protein GCM10010168_65570 [Actinoplanes ianthinogenes]
MTAAELLAASGRFTIAPGLSDRELSDLEAEFGFTFAPDHRAFLAAGLPTGIGWPDWRGGDRSALRSALTAPVEGVLFDVAENDFWYEGWGAPFGDRVATARAGLMIAPRMVPLYAHRYLPAAIPGHPVLSIYQSDVLCYGVDLSDWLHREFGLGEPANRRVRPTVPFWSALAS